MDDSHKTLLVRKSLSFQSDVYTDRDCPVLNFTWTLPNHVQLSSGESSDKFKILTNGTLVIKSVDLTDQGSYSVEVVSSGGSDSRAFSIDVICNQKPKEKFLAHVFFQVNHALFAEEARRPIFRIRTGISLSDKSGPYESATISTPT